MAAAKQRKGGCCPDLEGAKKIQFKPVMNSVFRAAGDLGYRLGVGRSPRMRTITGWWSLSKARISWQPGALLTWVVHAVQRR